MKDITISGMHCEACEKTITRTLEKGGAKVHAISHKKGKATISGVSDQEADALIKPKGYRVRGSSSWSFEKSLLTNSFLILIGLTLLQAMLILFVYAKLPGYNGKYLLPLLYLPFVITTNLVALWHQRSYGSEVGCMAGMMIGMTMGMMAGFMIGAIVGLINGMFIGSLVGVGIGLAAGVYAGRCCGIMGTMEGMMAGLMGGLMGAMTSTMMVADHIEIFLPILLVICATILGGLIVMVAKDNASTKPKPWPLWRVTAIGLFLTVVIGILIIFAPKGIY
jgi:copper chaperone CopZ